MIIEGLKFAEKHGLTRKEIQIILRFIEKPKTILEVAKELGDNKPSLHNKVLLLKAKGMVELKDKEQNGVIIYGVTEVVKNSLNDIDIAGSAI